MGPHLAIVWIVLASGLPRGADVSWTAGGPLWTSLSPAGKVVDAGPVAAWASPPPAARLASPAPAPPPLPAPHELPEVLGDPAGPVLPPATPVSQLIITSPTPMPLPSRPEPVSPPIAVQATHARTRPIRPAGDRYSPGKAFVPVRAADDGPAARLAPPTR